MDSMRARARAAVSAAIVAVLVAAPTAATASPPQTSGVVVRESGPALVLTVDGSTGLALLVGGEVVEDGGACDILPGGLGTVQLTAAPGSGLHVLANDVLEAKLYDLATIDQILQAVHDEAPCPTVAPVGTGTMHVRNVVSTAMGGGAFVVSFTATGSVETASGGARVVARRSIVVAADGSLRRDVSSIHVAG